MDSLYLWLKFVHVVAAVVSVGGFFALTVLNARIARAGEPAAAAALGQQSEVFGRTVLGPAMGILLIAGLWMAGQFGIPFTDLWIVWGLVGFVLFVLLGVVGLGRAGAELGEVARTAGANDPRVDALRQRMSLLSWLSLLVLLSVIWAMVLKPTLKPRRIRSPSNECASASSKIPGWSIFGSTQPIHAPHGPIHAVEVEFRTASMR